MELQDGADLRGCFSPEFKRTLVLEKKGSL